MSRWTSIRKYIPAVKSLDVHATAAPTYGADSLFDQVSLESLQRNTCGAILGPPGRSMTTRSEFYWTVPVLGLNLTRIDVANVTVCAPDAELAQRDLVSRDRGAMFFTKMLLALVWLEPYCLLFANVYGIFTVLPPLPLRRMRVWAPAGSCSSE